MMAGKTDKKEAIVNAMLDLVVERGFHNSPMSLLAERSGASPGVIYHYFPSKDDLIHAAYLRVAAVKHEVFFTGLTQEMTPREALLRIWLNAYRFYRTHLRETRFLDQYLNSPYCSVGLRMESEHPSQEATRIQKWLRPAKKGGLLKDLPPEAIDSLTLALAASLAKAKRPFSQATLRRIAETVWAAIAERPDAGPGEAQAGRGRD